MKLLQLVYFVVLISPLLVLELLLLLLKVMLLKLKILRSLIWLNVVASGRV